MVHRGLALIGHGGIPALQTWISQVGEEAGILPVLRGDARPADRSEASAGEPSGRTQRARIASPAISPATRPMPKAATTVSVGWRRTRPSALS